jgi:hypothetical protein
MELRQGLRPSLRETLPSVRDALIFGARDREEETGLRCELALVRLSSVLFKTINLSCLPLKPRQCFTLKSNSG